MRVAHVSLRAAALRVTAAECESVAPCKHCEHAVDGCAGAQAWAGGGGGWGLAGRLTQCGAPPNFGKAIGDRNPTGAVSLGQFAADHKQEAAHPETAVIQRSAGFTRLYLSVIAQRPPHTADAASLHSPGFSVPQPSSEARAGDPAASSDRHRAAPLGSACGEQQGSQHGGGGHS